jgi:hypothetical protein
MPDDVIDEPEFTDEQLRALLHRVAQVARAKAFAAGLPVHFIKNGAIVALHPDGTEEVVKLLSNDPATGRKR